LLDCAAAGVLTLDPLRRIIALNAVAERLLGVTAADLLGNSPAVLPPEVRILVEESFSSGLAVGRRIVAGPTGSGQVVVSTNVSRDKAGVITAVTAELQDLAAAQSIALNLEHLDRLAGLGVVTAGVAHEVKNALVAVRTFFDLLCAGENDPDLRSVAAAEVQRIERIVRQLLRGARREEFRLTPLSVHALLQDALNLVRHELQTRAIELDTSLRAAHDRVNADERQLRHAIVNLLMNAAEAMEPAGRLTLATAVSEKAGQPHLCVTIADTGCGISPENVARLFSPFFTTKPEGTGIGLAISRRIVQAHNGIITVESRVKLGTTFEVYLPLFR